MFEEQSKSKKGGCSSKESEGKMGGGELKKPFFWIEIQLGG